MNPILPAGKREPPDTGAICLHVGQHQEEFNGNIFFSHLPLRASVGQMNSSRRMGPLRVKMCSCWNIHIQNSVLLIQN